MRSRRALAAATLLLTSLAALPPAARAEEPTPPPAGAPVTRADRVVVAADGATEIDVLANDSDPDAATNDDLAACRLEPSAHPTLNVAQSAGYDASDQDFSGRPVLTVYPFEAEPGTYTVDYYVCDYDYLTPATLTVVVTGPQSPYARVLRARPGHVRFHNPGRKRAVIRYGSKDGRTIDGKFVLAPHTARTVRTTRRAIQWTATFRTPFGSSSSGQILSGIQQPARPVAPDAARPLALTPADRTAWRLGTRQIALRSSRSTQQSAPATGNRAEPGDAPVTEPDAVAVSRGYFGLANVLGNDTDPDATRHEDLAICRASAPARSGLEVTPIAGDSFVILTAGRGPAPRAVTDDVATAGDPVPYTLLVQASDRTARGTYEVTYHACNRQYLTSSTLTVTVTRSQKVTARKLRGRPGVVRFRNPGPHAAKVVVREFEQLSAPGRRSPVVARFRLPAETARNVRPGVRAVWWEATSRRGPGGFGIIDRIAVRSTAGGSRAATGTMD